MKLSEVYVGQRVAFTGPDFKFDKSGIPIHGYKVYSGTIMQPTEGQATEIRRHMTEKNEQLVVIKLDENQELIYKKITNVLGVVKD